MSFRDKPLPQPTLTPANHPTPKQMLYTPFSFRRDRQKQIESTIFFQSAGNGFASANTSVTNLTIPHGHNYKRSSYRQSVNYRDSRLMSAPQDGYSYYGDSDEPPPVPGIPSPYQAYAAPAVTRGNTQVSRNPTISTANIKQAFSDEGSAAMPQYDTQTFESLREQVLNRQVLQGFPIDSQAHSWVFDNGMKCREDVRERNGSVLWGGKWAGDETCVNVYDWDTTEGPVFHHALDDNGIDHLLKSSKKPSIRIYFIAEAALQDQMSATLSTLSRLFTHHNVPPPYMDIALMTTSGSCGQRVLYEQSRNQKTARKKVVGYDIYYELRHSFTTNETHRQLVNLHYDPVRRSIVVFFIGSQIREAQQRVHQIFSTSKKPFESVKRYYETGLGIDINIQNDSDDEGGESSGANGGVKRGSEVEDLLEDPFSLLTVFLNLTFDDLFQIQAEFDMQVWRLTSDFNAFSLNNAKRTLTAVHQLASNSLRHATQLSRLFQTSVLVRSHHHSFLDKLTKSNNNDYRNSFISPPSGGLDWMIGREVNMGTVSERVSDEIALLVEKSRDLKGWAVEREGIIRNDINLRYNIIAQRDSRTSASIAKDSRRDSGSMKAIAILTMIFLPGTFVATVLQLPFWTANTLARGWGVFWAVTTPLTIAVLLIWWAWQYRNGIEHRKAYEEEEGRVEVVGQEANVMGGVGGLGAKEKMV